MGIGHDVILFFRAIMVSGLWAAIKSVRKRGHQPPDFDNSVQCGVPISRSTQQSVTEQILEVG
jgi:hypothetical protein